MSHILPILAGALFVGAASFSAGVIFIRSLRLALTAVENVFFAFLSGAALLGITVFALTALHLAYLSTFLVVGALLVGTWAWRIRTSPDAALASNSIPKLWLTIALLFSLRYAYLYLCRALGPEYSFDATFYHLVFVARYLREHHFPLITNNMYANFPEALEMLFLVAFSIGKHSAAAVTHLLFLFALVIGMAAFGIRFHIPKAGIAAGAIFFMVPIAGLDASVAYNDIALTAAGFATFYILQIWRERFSLNLTDPLDDTILSPSLRRMLASREPVATRLRHAAAFIVARMQASGLLILAGILAGFAAGLKYTGFAAIFYAVGFVAWHERKSFRRLANGILAVSLPAFVMVGPWLVKNAIEVHNPVSPFANRIFPNPFVHISFETAYLQGLKHFNGVKLSDIPFGVTFDGNAVQGLIGPLFLLSPIALLALRTSLGRRLLLAWGVFLLSYFGNIGTRFLLPSLPFLVLAMAQVLSSWRAALPIVLIFQFLSCWPNAVEQYANASLRIERMRWDEALRKRPEAETLSERLGGYKMARYIDQHLPPDTRIFEWAGLPAAYMKQQIDEYYVSARNEYLSLLFAGGVSPDFQPTWQATLRVPSSVAKKLTISLTNVSKTELWAIAEAHFQSNGNRVSDELISRVTSNVFPWDLPLLHDGNLATIWKSWQLMKPGMRMSFEFRRPLTVDEIVLVCSLDQWHARYHVSITEPSGETMELVPQVQNAQIPLVAGYRRMIIEQFKHYGYSYLVLGTGHPCFPAIEQNPADWGLRPVVKIDNLVLFSLD